jgi:DNA replication protein DnaD
LSKVIKPQKSLTYTKLHAIISLLIILIKNIVGVLKLINERINAICNLGEVVKTECKITIHESRFLALSEDQKLLLARIQIFLDSECFSVSDIYNSGFSHPNRMESVINSLVELGLIQKSPKEDKNTIDQIYFLSSNYLQIIKEFKKTLI